MNCKSQSSETNANGPNSNNVKIGEDYNPLDDRNQVGGDDETSKLRLNKALSLEFRSTS